MKPEETPDRLFADYYDWAGALAYSLGVFWPGADVDDVKQEARIALWKAAGSFKRRGSFPAFARLVIKRHLIDCAFKLRRIEGVDKRVPQLAWAQLPETWEPLTPSLEEQVEQRAELRRLAGVLRDELTPIELEAYQRRIIHEEPYRDIFASGGPSFRRLDNALQRAKQKLAA